MYWYKNWKKKHKNATRAFLNFVWRWAVWPAVQYAKLCDSTLYSFVLNSYKVSKRWAKRYRASSDYCPNCGRTSAERKIEVVYTLIRWTIISEQDVAKASLSKSEREVTCCKVRTEYCWFCSYVCVVLRKTTPFHNARTTIITLSKRGIPWIFSWSTYCVDLSHIQENSANAYVIWFSMNVWYRGQLRASLLSHVYHVFSFHEQELYQFLACVFYYTPK